MLTKTQRDMILGIGGEDMLKRVLLAEAAEKQAAKSNDVLTASKTAQPSLIELMTKTRPITQSLIDMCMKGIDNV